MFCDTTTIDIQNVSKCYQIYGKPRDRLEQFVMPSFSRALEKPASVFYKDFCALNGISFTVKRGEAVGIIGRNGSGKSTLLQTIARTLTPTTGEISVRGGLAARLKLGAGSTQNLVAETTYRCTAQCLE